VAIKPDIKTPREFINPLLAKKSIDKAKFDSFKEYLEKYKNTIDAQYSTNQTEPNIVSNALQPFIQNLDYIAEVHSQNGQSGIDLAIKKNHQVAVVIEAKKYQDKDMITKNDLDKKSFHEAILYFFRERDKGNNSVFHIIITDFYGWFVFDAKDFDRLFWHNKTLKKIYTDHKDPSIMGDKTKDFYESIARELPKIKINLFDDTEIECAYFNLKTGENATSEKELTSIYKLLSSDGLLKEFNPNDANSLNREFYSELLYILGLEEVKDGGKKLISRAKVPQNGSFYENISNKLGHYTKPNDFETIIKLIIIWINRILFLKLLEGQIVSWNGNNKEYKFLDSAKINDFDKLEMLFFEILAKKIVDRQHREFDYIPYLNSSLFEMHEQEDTLLKISNLSDDATIEYYSKTVIRDEKTNRKSGSVSTLAYLFEFLDSYDFGSSGSDDIFSSQNKTLINASVLGLIFEKINGYKDGSFYTPSFITMYMARESLQKSILDKFNQAFEDLVAKSWHELVRYSDKHSHKDEFINNANNIIDSITICDPAVGSGHFLVSALNEIIYIKHQLGLYAIRGLDIKLENDELIVSLYDEWFNYVKPKSFDNDNHKVQKLLFTEKQRIIENQLFGVDINPNSAQITKLRLWIELLKNSYYDENYQLVTLPNIDINIKTGNSLISRFDLKDELKINNIKEEIRHYKQVVNEYKENIGSKREVMISIQNLKDKFRLTLKAEYKLSKELEVKLKTYVSEYGYNKLSTDLTVIAATNRYGQTTSLFGDEVDSIKQAKLLIELDKILSQIDEIEKGKIYENAFEWRFEFPEVLDENGEFIGFDIVIGNPPYVNLKLFDKQTIQYLENSYSDIHTGYNDILYYFFGKGLSVLAPNGTLLFIASNYFLGNTYAQKLRTTLTPYISQIINFKNFMVFDEASVHTAIIGLEKTPQNSVQVCNAEDGKLDHIPFNLERAKLLDTWLVVDGNTAPIFEKIENDGILMDNISTILKGATSGSREIFTVKKDFAIKNKLEIDLLRQSISSKDIQKYELKDSGEFLIYIDNSIDIQKYPNIENYLKNYYEILSVRNEVKKGLYAWYRLERPRNKDIFEADEKIIVPYRAEHNKFAFDNNKAYNDGGGSYAIIITNMDFSIKYVLALLNSKLFDWYYGFIGKPKGDAREYFNEPLSKIPLKKISHEAQAPFIALANKIMELKKVDSKADTTELENQIDKMVYELYGLTEEEIRVVEARG
jgi:adenine-specific DNA-methyltransferase